MTDEHTRYRTYRVWTSLKNRCLNPRNAAYPSYGGRGIKVCDRWLESFDNFVEDMGYRPTPEFSLDRTDNDGDYSPDNCRWATRKEQIRNRRNTLSVTYRGKRITIAELSELVDIGYDVLKMRHKRGWGIDRLIQPPYSR